MISRSLKQPYVMMLAAWIAVGAVGGDAARAQTIHSSDCSRALAQMAGIVARARRDFVNKCENPVRESSTSCGSALEDGHPFCSPACRLTHVGDSPRGWTQTMKTVDDQHACSRGIGDDALAAMGLKEGAAGAPRASTGAASTQASQKFKDLQKTVVAEYAKDYEQDHDSNAGMQGRLMHTIWEINRILAAPPLPATGTDVPDSLRSVAARRTLRRIVGRIDAFVGKMQELKAWADHAPSGSSYLYKAREAAIQNAYALMMTGCPGDNFNCDHPHREPQSGSLMGTKSSLASLLDAVGERPNAPAPAAPRQGDPVSNLKDHVQWLMTSPDMTRFYENWDQVRLVRHCRGMLFDIGANSGVRCETCPTAQPGGDASPSANTPVIAPSQDDSSNVCIEHPSVTDAPNMCVAENVVPPNPPVTPVNTGGLLTPNLVQSVMDWGAIQRRISSGPDGANGQVIDLTVPNVSNPGVTSPLFVAPVDCRFGAFPGCPSAGETSVFVVPDNGSPLNSNPNATIPILTLPIGQ